MAFNNEDFQKMRKQRLRDRFFDNDFDKEREMFFNTSPSFQSFFNRRGYGFTRPTRPQSQPSFGKMWEEDSDGLPPNAKVRYIPVQHDWTTDPNRTSEPPSPPQSQLRPPMPTDPENLSKTSHWMPSEEHVNHPSPQHGTPPVQSEFTERSEIPSPSNQQIPNQPREYIIPIKILDKDVSNDFGSAPNLPRYQPQRGHSLNDDSRRLHANRFHLDEMRPHSTPNSPNIWPRSRHTSGPIFSQVYEPRKMEATMESDEPKRDSKEYIIPVRMVPSQNHHSERSDVPSSSTEEEDPRTPISVQKLKAQFEPPAPKPQPQSRPPLQTDPDSLSKASQRPEHQERVYRIPVIRETSPMTGRQRSMSPQRQTASQRQPSPPFASPRQPSPPFASQRQSSPPFVQRQSSASEVHIQKPPELNRAPTPEPPKQMSAMDKIHSIEADIREMESSVRNFEGKKTDKHYLFLDEMLTRQLIKLDVIEADGVPEIRQARKAMVQLINELVSELENKASQSKVQEDKDTQVSQPTNIPLNVSLQLSMDDLASINPESVDKNNLHISHVEIHPAAPHITQVEISNSGQNVTHVDVNQENDNTEKHISRVEINMDCKNNKNNNCNLESSQGNNSNLASSESSHMLSTSV